MPSHARTADDLSVEQSAEYEGRPPPQLTCGGATSFNGDLNRWDVSQVTTLLYTFFGATSFNGDLNRWDVSQVTDIYVRHSSRPADCARARP